MQLAPALLILFGGHIFLLTPFTRHNSSLNAPVQLDNYLVTADV